MAPMHPGREEGSGMGLYPDSLPFVGGPWCVGQAFGQVAEISAIAFELQQVGLQCLAI